jgi:signal peptidase I
MVAVHAKRWHDRDKSAWWFLLAASPFNGVTAVVILWIVIECAFQLGNPKDNKFGAPTGGTLVEVGSAERYQPVLVILLVSATLLSMCFPRYRIHSGAMMPTLLVGDFILVNRTAYGIPMPFAYGNLVPLDQPVRGDVIVFKYPDEPSVEYLQRIVAGPGDRIAYQDKQLYINGQPVPQYLVGQYTGDSAGSRMTGALRKIERLGEVEHTILIESDKPDYAPDCAEMTGVENVVPAGHYFVMGDNRDNSKDSRCWGFVPREQVRGKVSRVWMNWDSTRQNSPIIYSRLWSLVR